MPRANGSYQAPIKAGGEEIAAGGKRSPKTRCVSSAASRLAEILPNCLKSGSSSGPSLASNIGDPFGSQWLRWEGRGLPGAGTCCHSALLMGTRIIYLSLKRWNSAAPWVGGCVSRVGGERDALPWGGSDTGQWLGLVKPHLGLRFWRCDGVSSVITELSYGHTQHWAGAAAGVLQQLYKGGEWMEMDFSGLWLACERDYSSWAVCEQTPMAVLSRVLLQARHLVPSLPTAVFRLYLCYHLQPRGSDALGTAGERGWDPSA